MIADWFLELARAAGRLFMQPQLYLFILAAFLLGKRRVKRERLDFHTRVHDVVADLKALFQGVLFGMAVSVLTFGLGLALPLGVLALLAVLSIVLAVTLQVRWLSPAYLFSSVILAALFLPEMEIPNSFMNSLLQDIYEASVPGLAVMMGILIVTEGLLIIYKGRNWSSPQLKMGKRGKTIGSHSMKRLWLLPVLLLVPAEGITPAVEWWPVITVGGTAFAFWFVPFGIGFSQRVQGSLPEESVRVTGRRVTALGVLVTAVAVSAIWFPLMAAAAAGTALLGREFLTVRQRHNDDQNTTYFSRRDHGLVILGVLPGSPADKLNLHVGEIVTIVNGNEVHTEEGFYEALQQNLAFCKLEVLDHNGEVRLVQRAIYEDEHHELGLLFVQDEREMRLEEAANQS
ncbi:PDZ domain-containing protein [Bacillus marinisedimentorum]|uniref:PDZ domain-containing protein n=1 Tax=Bacillus marinisedimentorum TaxID=1821260 RepID=UPI0007DFBBDA|nr:PDZ domain-containing protein [Bacillus marinisedimentorum]